MEMIVHTTLTRHPNLGCIDKVDGYVNYLPSLKEAKTYVETSIREIMKGVADDEDDINDAFDGNSDRFTVDIGDRWAHYVDADEGVEESWAIVHTTRK